MGQHYPRDSSTVCLPVKVTHDCLCSLGPSLLQQADDLEGCLAAPARMDGHRTPELGLRLRRSLQHPALALSQRPGAAYFSHHTTLDVGPIRSTEDLINDNPCQLESRETRFWVMDATCVGQDQIWFADSVPVTLLRSS